jgi:SnoaL-like domain
MTPADCVGLLEIQQLKARYARFADSKYGAQRCRKPRAALDRAAREQANCFTADAVWDGGREFGRRLTGRKALFRFFREGPWKFALHYYVAPIIEVHGDSARGWWRLWQIGIPRLSDEVVLFAAVTAENYRREEGVWLHSAVRFEHAHFVRRSAGDVLHLMDKLM